MLGSTPTYLPTGEDLPRKPRQSVLFLSCYYLYEKLSQSLSAQINPNLLVDGEDSPYEPRQSVSFLTGNLTERNPIPITASSRLLPPHLHLFYNSYSSITNSSLSGLGDKWVVITYISINIALGKLTVFNTSVMPHRKRWYRELSRFFPVYALLKAVVWNHKKISGGRSRGGGGICSCRQKRVTVEYNEYVYPAGSSQR